MKHLVGILLLIAQTLSWAELELTAESPFGLERVYVDWSTVQVVGSSRRIWTLADWGAPDENGVRFAYGEHEYQCQEGRTRPLTLTFFAEQDVTPVGSQPQPGEWIVPSPYSLAGVVLAAVCRER
jgi:hypothetical protein